MIGIRRYHNGVCIIMLDWKYFTAHLTPRASSLVIP